MLDQVLTDWDLDASKQVAITTDNASNITKAVRDQGERLTLVFNCPSCYRCLYCKGCHLTQNWSIG